MQLNCIFIECDWVCVLFLLFYLVAPPLSLFSVSLFSRNWFNKCTDSKNNADDDNNNKNYATHRYNIQSTKRKLIICIFQSKTGFVFYAASYIRGYCFYIAIGVECACVRVWCFALVFFLYSGSSHSFYMLIYFALSAMWQFSNQHVATAPIAKSTANLNSKYHGFDGVW